ncbi:MAG: hypothetical protein OXF98_13475 [Rhodospirillaceae bacterium]|nr:hypothetical protein [Rhodospirillaceae bacterium]
MNVREPNALMAPSREVSVSTVNIGDRVVSWAVNGVYLLSVRIGDFESTTVNSSFNSANSE